LQTLNAFQPIAELSYIMRYKSCFNNPMYELIVESMFSYLFNK
jgi:hypothetical protein